MQKEENMRNWRKYAVVGLVVCLLHLSLADAAQSAGTTTTLNPALAKQQVSQLGVGAKVKVELASGKRLKGSIQAVEDTGFLLTSNNAASPTRVAYGEVAELKSTTLRYAAKGQPDAAQVKRVAAGLGVGPHIVVETAKGKVYHGHIAALDAETFTLMPDRADAPVPIAYNSVKEMGPSMTRRTGLIVAGAVLGGLLVWIIVALSLTGGD
jgi:ribosome maturation factor RimP